MATIRKSQLSLNSLLSHFYHVHLTTSFVCWYNLKIVILATLTASKDPFVK